MFSGDINNYIKSERFKPKASLDDLTWLKATGYYSNITSSEDFKPVNT